MCCFEGQLSCPSQLFCWVLIFARNSSLFYSLCWCRCAFITIHAHLVTCWVECSWDFNGWNHLFQTSDANDTIFIYLMHPASPLVGYFCGFYIHTKRCWVAGRLGAYLPNFVASFCQWHPNAWGLHCFSPSVKLQA